VDFKTLGRYTLLEKISSGGMGDVYLAVSPGAQGLFKFVALKKVHSEFMHKPETKRFFETEGKIGLHLSHSNLVQMYEASAVGNEFFFVMEYIDGITIGSLIKKLSESRKTLPPHLLFYVLTEFANALAYIHAYTNPAFRIDNGIIHQDISANNVMVDFNGRVKIIDFGIAKPQSLEEKSSLIVGKLGYMSPEQATRAPVSHRSDIYAFGVTMWELICGVRLFAGSDTQAINKKKMMGRVPPLNVHNQSIPKSLQAVVTRCLKIHPEDRYESMKEVLQDLYLIMETEKIHFQNGEMAAFLEEEFRFEKQTNSQKLRQYSQDILSAKLKIKEKTKITAEDPDLAPVFTEIVATVPGGVIQQKKFILVHEQSCALSHFSVVSRDELLIEGSLPQKYWGKRCQLLYKKTASAKAKSYWIFVSADGKRLQRRYIEGSSLAAKAEHTVTQAQASAEGSKTIALALVV